jgi:hypothetical protein
VARVGRALQDRVEPLFVNVFDHERWIASMNELAAELTAGFQARFGYPPDENKVTPATGPLPEGVEQLLAPLAEFYRHVEQVSLPDLQNAYFVSMAQATVNGRDGRLPVRIEGPITADVVSFGSDGGGTLFALGLPDGAPVYMLPPSGFDDAGVYDDHDSRVRVVAANLPEFLEKLQVMLDDFLHDRYDGSRCFPS